MSAQKKFVVWFLMLLGLLWFWVSVLQCSAQGSRDCVRAAYMSQVGVRELSGHNDGQAVEMYLASCKLKAGAPWCAAFVNWCLKSCGAPHSNSGWSPDWFPPDKVIWTGGSAGRGKDKGLSGDSGALPLPGDVLGIYFPSKKRIAHVLFCEEWRGRTVVTVEGNTNEAGSREGDGVYRKIRLTAQIDRAARWIK
jgi:hypothetical protein